MLRYLKNRSLRTHSIISLCLIAIAAVFVLIARLCEDFRWIFAAILFLAVGNLWHFVFYRCQNCGRHLRLREYVPWRYEPFLGHVPVMEKLPVHCPHCGEKMHYLVPWDES